MLGMFGSRSGKRAGDAGRRAISDPQRSLPSSSHNPEERYTLCTDSPPMRHRYPALFGCAVEKVAKVWAAPISQSAAYLPAGLADELRQWKVECKDPSPNAFIFPMPTAAPWTRRTTNTGFSSLWRRSLAFPG